MSREFGSYCAGYLHDQMVYAEEDCRDGRDELTKKMAPLFRELHMVMHAVCSSEASDSGPEWPIQTMIRTLPNIKNWCSEMESYLEPFDRVAKEAIREYQKSNNLTK